MESFVAVMALIAACVLQPGVYFAMNAPPALIGTTVESAAAAIASWGFVITPDVLASTAQQIGEHTILSRTGGAPTLAVGMAQILNDLIGGSGMLAFWYHYAILFEALFILTTLDAGTRVARFMIQDLVGVAYAPFRRTESWTANVVCTATALAAHEYAHLAGFADEADASIVAWLACQGGSPALRYSSALAVLPHLLTGLPRAHTAGGHRRARGRACRGLRAIAARLSDQRPWVHAFAWQTYDRFLRANRVSEGVARYDAVARVLIGAADPATGTLRRWPPPWPPLR